MNSVSRFDERVENYVKYRPHYPKEILDLFYREMGLDASSIIADIGSGTGISAKLFLENGNRVYGIEPNAAMRQASAGYLRDFKDFFAIDGTAEETTLEPDCVDFIVAAQAFHWFDNAKAPVEFRRILRKHSFTALIWNERQLDANEFLRKYERFLLDWGNDYQSVRHDQVNLERIELIFDADFRSATFENSQTLDFKGLMGRLASASYMPSEDDVQFPEMEKSLNRLFTEHQEKGRIRILYNTNVYYGII